MKLIDQIWNLKSTLFNSKTDLMFGARKPSINIYNYKGWRVVETSERDFWAYDINVDLYQLGLRQMANDIPLFKSKKDVEHFVDTTIKMEKM